MNDRLKHRFKQFLTIAVPFTAQLGPQRVQTIYTWLAAELYHFEQLLSDIEVRGETGTWNKLAQELATRDAMPAGDVPDDTTPLDTPGNFGFGLWVGTGERSGEHEYLGASRRAQKMIRALSGEQRWTCVELSKPARYEGVQRRDSEYKILNKLAERLPMTARGTLFLFSERLPCASCEGVIAAFLHDYTNVRLSLAYLVEGANDGEQARVPGIRAMLDSYRKGHTLYRLNTTRLVAGPLKRPDDSGVSTR